MLTKNDVALFAHACTRIGNDCADENGFVRIQSLLNKFQAKLVMRPLLVEGMLAFVNRKTSHEDERSQWTVLVDSESYRCTESDVVHEVYEQPLPDRFRNTVAHELAHSLAFRPSEFGVRLTGELKTKESRDALVNAIEQETERLSPLLLWPDKSIKKMLSNKIGPVTAEELDRLHKAFGISRYVLVNRLCLLHPADSNGFRSHPGLKNTAIGLGEWIENGRAVLKKWPLFINFERNVVPEFLLRLLHQNQLLASEIFDSNFAMCGGKEIRVEFESKAGVAAVPDAENMRIQCSIENTKRARGSTFLWVVNKAPNYALGGPADPI